MLVKHLKAHPPEQKMRRFYSASPEIRQLGSWDVFQYEFRDCLTNCLRYSLLESGIGEGERDTFGGGTVVDNR